MSETPRCAICGEPMPAGEEMFKYHGYSGNCPKPPLPRPQKKSYEELERELSAANAEVVQLRGENKQLKSDAGKWIVDQAYVTGLETGGGLSVGFQGAACQMFAAMVAGEFKGAGGINYVQMTMTHPETGPLVLTMQRLAGKTPHALRTEAEAKLTAAERERDEAREDVERLDFLTTTDVEVWEMNGHWWLQDFRTAGDPEPQQFTSARAAIDTARAKP